MTMIMVMVVVVVGISGVVAVLVRHNAQDGRWDSSAGEQPASGSSSPVILCAWTMLTSS
ncbi:MAG TPA: hypothetical protein VLM11_07960 [Streptosporangiaceae bacterium]|nr:hypothetical protein [Streptosporangiaceae bacterium]